MAGVFLVRTGDEKAGETPFRLLITRPPEPVLVICFDELLTHTLGFVLEES